VRGEEGRDGKIIKGKIIGRRKIGILDRVR